MADRPAIHNHPGGSRHRRSSGRTTAGALWSACSSLAHGDISGTLGLLRYEIVSREQRATVRLTGNFSMPMPRVTTQAGIGPIDHALALYRHRAANTQAAHPAH